MLKRSPVVGATVEPEPWTTRWTMPGPSSVVQALPLLLIHSPRIPFEAPGTTDPVTLTVDGVMIELLVLTMISNPARDGEF